MLVHTHKDMKTKGINFRETAPSGVTKDATVTQVSYRLQATDSSARPNKSIELSLGFQNVHCLIEC